MISLSSLSPPSPLPLFFLHSCLFPLSSLSLPFHPPLPSISPPSLSLHSPLSPHPSLSPPISPPSPLPSPLPLPSLPPSLLQQYEDKDIGEVLNKVAVFKRNAKGKKGTYELSPTYEDQQSLFFCHYTRVEQSKVCIVGGTSGRGRVLDQWAG